MVIVVLALLAGVHRYLWRRLVGDTTAEGSAMRRAGTVAAYVLPLLSVGALVSGRAGAPFWLQRVLAWPGYLWLAAVLYLTLALLVGEAVRPVLRRVLERRADRAGRPDDADTASVDGANGADPASDANNASSANHSNLSVGAPDASGTGTSAAAATLVADAPAPPRPGAPG
ncbi:metallophosphoesterase, partial [Streptomyces sp. Wh19]|nr:metallophosphoesterase [Streptomyces sp. Wh19]